MCFALFFRKGGDPEDSRRRGEETFDPTDPTDPVSYPFYPRVCCRLTATLFFLALSAIPISCFGPAGSSGSGGDEALVLSLLMTQREDSPPCPGETIPPAGVYLADMVQSAPSATGSGFGDSALAVNGVCGAGLTAGSLDVFSLSATGAGAVLILEWSGRRVLNGSGIDFVVYENAFNADGDTDRFMDPLVVDVGNDLSTWCGFQADYTAVPETVYSSNPLHWSNFAGKSPVLFNQVSNPLGAEGVFDPAKGGGDGFDLDALSGVPEFGNGCNATLRSAILSGGFVYLRLRSASALTNPDTGGLFVHDIISNGSDIDGAAARYVGAR